MPSDLDEKSQMLGQHEARLDNLEASMKEIRDDVKVVRAYLERTKGTWKTLVAIGGITTGVIEILHQVIDWLHSK